MGRTSKENIVYRGGTTYPFNTLAIDPGVAGSGVAVWLAGEKYPCFNEAVKKKDRKAYRNYFAELLHKFEVKYVMIEKPAFQNSVKGQMALRKGDLIELTLFVGGMEMALMELGAEVELIDVSLWKGQLPKEVVNTRIKSVFPEVNAKSHDWDAIGIGLWGLKMINC